jgi:hypothetical protein
MFVLYAGHVIRNNEADITTDEYGNDTAADDEGWVRGLKYVRTTINIVFIIFILVVTTRARGCCCCQMLRHTADYHKYQAGCCTQMGLANGTSEAV